MAKSTSRLGRTCPRSDPAAAPVRMMVAGALSSRARMRKNRLTWDGLMASESVFHALDEALQDRGGAPGRELQPRGLAGAPLAAQRAPWPPVRRAVPRAQAQGGGERLFRGVMQRPPAHAGIGNALKGGASKPRR